MPMDTAVNLLRSEPRPPEVPPLSMPLSVLAYSHDGFGLGHLRRNTRIAKHVVNDVPDASVLMLVGCPSGVLFDLPPGVDFVKLPSVVKVATNRWRPSNLRFSSNKTMALRTRLIQQVAELVEPSVFLVDHLPVGVGGELLPTLRMFRRMANPPKVVLGVRDILDDAEVLRKTWRRDGTYDSIAELYDAILVYGKSEIYDTVGLYGLEHRVPGGVHYCGYVRPEAPSLSRAQVRSVLGVERDKLAIVMAGGGRDAYPMMAAVMNGLRLLDDNDRPDTVFVAGPMMPAGDRAALTNSSAGLPARVVSSVPDGVNYINAADLVVSMGGYNTLMEAVYLNKQTLVIPRSGPSAEQRIRTKAFADRGLVRMVDPDEVTPTRLAQAIHGGLNDASPPSFPFGFDGLNMALSHIKRLLKADLRPTPRIEPRRLSPAMEA